jgi:DNA-binding PadR family transcriptional regulator
MIYHVLIEVLVSDLDRLVPLSPAVFHILLALADEDRHGYAVMRDIEERTGGVVRVGPGMLYGSIKWLLADGFIEASPARPHTDDDARRRYYRLTPRGRALLKTEAARLEAAVGLARSRHVLPRKA